MKLPFLVMLVLSGLVTGLVFSEPTSPPWRFLPAFCLATALGGVGFVAQAREKKRLTWVFSLSMMVLGLLPAASLVLRASLLPERGAQPAEAPVQEKAPDLISVRVLTLRDRIAADRQELTELTQKLGVNSILCGTDSLEMLRIINADQEMAAQLLALKNSGIHVLCSFRYRNGEVGEITDDGEIVTLRYPGTREEYRKFLLGTP